MAVRIGTPASIRAAGARLTTGVGERKANATLLRRFSIIGGIIIVIAADDRRRHRSAAAPTNCRHFAV
jgi:hypothetical protein